MSSALVLLLLAATPEVNAAPESDLPRFAISLYPGGMTVGPLYGATQGEGCVYFPTGLTVPLRADLALDVDVAFSLNHGAFNSNGGSFSVSAGPTWFPWAKNGLDGFFIGPRFQFEISQPVSELIFFNAGGDGGPIPIGTFVRRAFLLGVDVGWQFHLGRWLFGPMFGLSVGYAFDNHESVISPFDKQVMIRGFGNNVAPSVNLQLFKLGATF